MTTTTCDLNVDWNECACCGELRERVQSASDHAAACSQRLDQAWEEYRSEREHGGVAFGTTLHRAWQDRIDNLDRQLRDAESATGEAIDEWADCIRLHARLHEERQQANTTQAGTETEDMGEAPAPDCQPAAGAVRGIRITAYTPLQGGCHDVDPASLPEDFLDYLTNAASAAHHDMGVDASQYIPVAVVRSILTRCQTNYEQFRDFCTAHSLTGDDASGALAAIKRIRTEIDQLTTPTEETNNA